MHSPSTQNSVLNQFNIHRALSKSGVVDAEDLIVEDALAIGYTMPRLAGTSLSHSLDSLGDEEVLAVIRDVSFAAFCMHSIGFIHGDLTPNNIWVCRDGPKMSGKLLDLGFVAPIGVRTPREIRGTPGYIAPEFERCLPSHPASDAFSFGKVIEFVIPRIANERLQKDLNGLLVRCIHPIPEKRESDFAAIYEFIVRAARVQATSVFPHTSNLVPLRSTGLKGRVRLLRSQLLAGGHGQFVLCAGPAQSGKSELMRSASQILQMEGRPTIRIVDVVSVDELSDALADLLQLPDLSDGVVYFVETNPGFNLDLAQLKALRHGVPNNRSIILESRVDPLGAASDGLQVISTRPLNTRECIYATSHLLISSSIATPHSEALQAVTGGNPGRIRSVMTDYLISGRRARGEPLDFERRIFGAGSDACQASAESRHSAGDRSRLRELRSRLGQSLEEVRRAGRSQGKPPLSSFRFISETYSALGSVRRQSRWARKGVESYGDYRITPESRPSLEEYLRLMRDTFSPEQRISRLGKLEVESTDMTSTDRAMIKSEIGVAYIYAKKPTMALEPLHEALALSKKSPRHEAELATILNRLGTAKMLCGEHEPARTYLVDAARSARAGGDMAVLARINGNLGLLSLYSGRPESGLDYFRRHRISAANAGQYAEYLTTLVNETICLFDLGKNQAAERRARLAVSLAEMLADQMRLSYAYNNLGWILMARCQGENSVRLLRQSLAVRERTGDARGIADCLLNISRLHLLARDYSTSADLLAKAHAEYKSLCDQEGEWDCLRVQAKAALLQEDYARAQNLLSDIPLESRALLENDRADTCLLRLERQLWLGDIENARVELERVDSLKASKHVHHIGARRDLLAGHLAMLEGDFDAAHTHSSKAAEEFRKSGREDLLLDALTIIALYAMEVGNTSAARRNLQYVNDTTSRLREQIRE